ncbi:MAG: hypothetical protein QG652_114, partial [Pseudomonadota bacterium]|nr:hypothetical protein [Pseudomonadota bacterium]
MLLQALAVFRLKSFSCFFLCSLCCIHFPAYAIDVAGVKIPDSICINHGNSLQLNGAGVRRKVFTDIYVAALYLEERSSNANDIIYSETAKRIALHFVYKEVPVEKLIEGWYDGFVLNNDPQQLKIMQSRLRQSYDYFATMKSGDVIYLDYIPGKGTRLSIN